MTSIRVGCVGAGFIATRHLRVLATLPDVELAAVADGATERAESAAQDFGARAYEDGLEMLAAEDLDAVWLCVPPFAHGPLELSAAERGIPFFVEKPLALDLDTALRVAAAVADRGLMTAVGYHWRHLDVVQQAARVLEDAPAQLALGYWLDATPSAAWWSSREASGGQVLEQTTHIFDLARLLVGEVETVQAMETMAPRAELPAADVPTAATASLRFASGAIGSISSTCVLPWRHRVGLHLVTERGVVEVVERSLDDHELRVVSAGEERIVRSRQDPTEQEDRDFVDALLGRTDGPRVPYEEAVLTHALAAAADRSARDDVPVQPGVPRG